jgi:hypothetical protein
VRNGIMLAGLSFAVIALVSLVLVLPSSATRNHGLHVRPSAPLAQSGGPRDVQGQYRIRIKFGDVAARTATANLGRIRTVTPGPTPAISLR